METQNENQKLKLSLKEIFRNQTEICESISECIASDCPFYTNIDGCMVSDLDNILKHSDEIERICTEWEINKPTLAKKINDILKPYGMKLERNMIYITDENPHTTKDIIDRLNTILPKEAASDMD